MDSREIMEGHKVIFRVIVVPGADTVIEVDSREMDQVSEVEVDLTKVPNVSRPRVTSKTVSRDATRCYYCKEPGHISRFCDRCEEDERRLKRGSSNMMANIDSQV